MRRSTVVVAAVLVASSLLVSGTAEARRWRGRDVKSNSFGVGLGVPYGVLGGNIDFAVVPNVHLTLGLGTTVVAGPGYNAGVKFFLASPNSAFRPKVSAYYGVNSMIVVEDLWGNTEGDSYAGVSLGVGAQWMWGRSKSNGLDFDIIYIASSSWDLEELERQGFDVEEPGKIKISIGWRRTY